MSVWGLTVEAKLLYFTNTILLLTLGFKMAILCNTNILVIGNFIYEIQCS